MRLFSGSSVLAGLLAGLLVGGCGGSGAAGQTTTLVASAPVNWSTVLFAAPNEDVYVALPPGWTQEPQRRTHGVLTTQIVPVGTAGTVGTNGIPIAGSYTGAYPSAGITFTPHPSGALLAAYHDRLAALNRAATALHSHVEPVAVNGAAAADRITDTFNADGHAYTESLLLMRLHSGAVLELIAGTFAGAPHGFPPSTLTGSVRLRTVRSLGG